MSSAMTHRDEQGELLERLIAAGDLSKLSPGERTQYYAAVCKSVGLNPLTRPFEYITLNGKLTLYARKDATDQLRKIHAVSIIDMTETERDGVCIITAKAQDASGRIDMAKGAVSLNGLKGEALANAIMKAETKAKRRVTLSICGLGILDETEIETIPTAHPVTITHDGEIIESKALKPAPIATTPAPAPATAEPEYTEDHWRVPAMRNQILDLETASGLGENACRDKLEKRFGTRAPWILAANDLEIYAKFLKSKVQMEAGAGA